MRLPLYGRGFRIPIAARFPKLGFPPYGVLVQAMRKRKKIVARRRRLYIRFPCAPPGYRKELRRRASLR